jgi:lysophospholipase L1-like esterase
VNRLIAATAHRYRKVVVANWFTTIGHRTGLLWPDGVHPQPGGARLYARMVAAALRAVRAADAGGSGRPPAVHHLALSG